MPVKGVKRPKGVEYLVECPLPIIDEFIDELGTETILRRDVRPPKKGEIMDVARGDRSGIDKLQDKYRELGIETKRAVYDNVDILVAYVPEELYVSPTRAYLKEIPFFGRLL